MHSAKTVAFLESYIGLVEAGVGLLPAGGGLKELAVRASVAAGPHTRTSATPGCGSRWSATASPTTVIATP